MGYHLTPVRMAQINKSGNNKCWQGCWERGNLLHCWECKLVQPLWKTVWRFLKKLKIELPYDLATALLGIYPKDTHVVIRKGTCTPMFIPAMTTIAKRWKGPVVYDEWIKKMCYIYMMEYYSAIKEDEIFTSSWMELEDSMQSEVSHSEKDNYHTVSFICGL